MKTKHFPIVLWMLAFAAATFLVWGTVVFIVAHTHSHLILLTYLDAIFEVIFFVAPMVALVFGLRGALPGTRRKLAVPDA